MSRAVKVDLSTLLVALEEFYAHLASRITHHASRITHHTHHLHRRTGVHAEVPQLAAVVRGAWVKYCNLTRISQLMEIRSLDSSRGYSCLGKT